MAATDGQIILAASRFGDAQPVYLKDFAKTDLPAVGKIVKGQYYNLGVPTLSNPSLQSTALFLNAGKKYQILAQPIKIKEGRKSTNVGPKVLIPETYPGYFELLSEDGRSTRCIESVLELSKRRNFRVLVRETVRCNHNSKSLHAGEILTTISDNGKYLQCKTSKDEIVNLPLEAKAKFSPIAKEDSISGVHTVSNLLQKRMPVTVRLVHGTAPKGLKQPFVPELRLLGCVEVDRIFALSLQKDMDLISVPLNAKIKIQRAKNMDQLDHFIEYSRFLDKAQRLLVDARDRLQIIDLKLGEKEKKETAKQTSNRKVASTLSAVTANGYVLKKSNSCDSNRFSPPLPGGGGGSGGGGGGSQNGSIADEYDEIDQIYDYVRGLAPLPKNLNKFEAIVEPISTSTFTHQHHLKTVENIKSATSNSINNNYSHYDTGNYSNIVKHSNNNNNNSVMNGHCLESTPTNNISSNNNHNNHIIVHKEEQKPIPPPIETIPGKKLPEKRQRPTLPKLYFKNNLGVHQKSPTSVLISPMGGGSPAGHPPPHIVGTPKEIVGEPQSPLFHIRYKSLSSLQLAQDSHTNTPISPSPKGGTTIINTAQAQTQQEKSHMLSKSASAGREGTLDSSRSGGRTSGDSKLPEKKTRRLSRPRSLSNLVWDLRPHKSEKSKKKLYLHQFDRQQGTLYL
ncbi:uncharacterized protein LOC129769835 [Toxorhynchites rutilus septentrionalis]|uniref:uncharacterized protein LOC129769835 n=1 Tax=Toxorhynchites rutilus septentrionalis TaxID=329112 RepID=UPI002478DE7B|nr:uncharacterized protein LOC129769835 [Toxorhynchites rutilus septentrionalis]XP_055628294.1 uncharacterized protein LOC129769835 [Toxorhynchites rutilus septentrionalis]XP_055628296.1 uncharacterized protein LOC129769835 [Toxorhynchites rutilus septentrionalis]XP_055628297.1 uncharacterized protein LOC129769835 [Toxorhynchites rutilus septentrionalis]